MNCDYVIKSYGVPAEIGRRVEVDGEPGVIAEDRGHYIGVNFDRDKPGVIRNCHPTWRVKYLGMGKVRNLQCGECFDDFISFCRWKDRAKEVAS